MRGRSYTTSSLRGYGRRRRNPGPRGGGRYDRGEAPTSLLVHNLRHGCRPEDLKRPFAEFGPIMDVYLPRGYYSGKPRGFGFVQYVHPADAADAKYKMDGQVMSGLELAVDFAEANRKKPAEMRARERGSERGGRDRGYDRRSPPRYSRSSLYSRSHRYSPSPRYYRSPPLRYGRSPAPNCKRNYYSSKRRYSRSVSPRKNRHSKERSSPVQEQLPNGSPVREQSLYGSRSRGQSPVLARSPPVRGRSPSRSRSRRPYPQDHARESKKDKSPDQ